MKIVARERRQSIKILAIYHDPVLIWNIEMNYTFTEAGDLDWLLDLSIPDDDFQDAYERFIRKRFMKMMSIILDNYSKL